MKSIFIFYFYFSFFLSFFLSLFISLFFSVFLSYIHLSILSFLQFLYVLTSIMSVSTFCHFDNSCLSLCPLVHSVRLSFMSTCTFFSICPIQGLS